jgi:LysM repeat protein
LAGKTSGSAHLVKIIIHQVSAPTVPTKVFSATPYPVVSGSSLKSVAHQHLPVQLLKKPERKTHQ